jgi:hypothetical protein
MPLDRSRLTTKVGAYALGTASALTDATLLGRVQAFRRQVSARMTALDRDGLERRLPDATYHISRKIDGEFGVLVWQDGECFLLNPGGTVRVGAPFLAEAADRLRDVSKALVAGELHVARADGKRPRVHDVVSVARNPASAADVASLRFAVFDVIDLDGTAFPGGYAEVWEEIQRRFGGGEHVFPVETVLGDAKETRARFRRWVDKEGAEGVIARSDAAGWFKIKPSHSLDLVVVGYSEGTDDRAGRLHDLLLALPRRDGAFHLVGRAGGGFTDEERVRLPGELAALEAESRYTEVNADRVAYRMIEPRLVAEILCLDLLAEDTSGKPVERMVLTWDPAARRWDPVRRLPLVSIVSPRFLRFRDDKQAVPEDLSMRQITDLVAVPQADQSLDAAALPKSELLRRRVAVKTLKGQRLVRKLLLWKTNKEAEEAGFPAYVIHLTDYSPSRQDPLQRELRVSDSREQIEELWNALEQETFVKGWEDITGPAAPS